MVATLLRADTFTRGDSGTPGDSEASHPYWSGTPSTETWYEVGVNNWAIDGNEMYCDTSGSESGVVTISGTYTDGYVEAKFVQKVDGGPPALSSGPIIRRSNNDNTLAAVVYYDGSDHIMRLHEFDGGVDNSVDLTDYPVSAGQIIGISAIGTDVGVYLDRVLIYETTTAVTKTFQGILHIGDEVFWDDYALLDAPPEQAPAEEADTSLAFPVGFLPI